jgi:ABC-type branched-subunit amino acid transport system ATPase component
VSPRQNGKRPASAGRRLLDELDATRAAAADDVADALGTGDAAVERADAAWRPSPLLVRLAALGLIAALPAAFVDSLAPQISDAVGTSRSALRGFGTAQWLTISLGALGLAALAYRRVPARRLIIVTAAVGALATVAAALAATGGAIGLALVAATAATASAQVLHPALLVDGHPPETRARALAAHRAAVSIGLAAAFGLAAALDGIGLTWRAMFLGAGALAVLVTAVAGARMRVPALGAYDHSPPVGLAESARRALHVPTVRRVIGVWAALGALVIPLLNFVGFFLADRWHVTATGRLGVLAVIVLVAVPVLGLVGPRADAGFAADPGRPLAMVVTALVIAAAGLVAAAASPWFGPAVVALGVAVAATTVVVPLLELTALSVVPSAARPWVAALSQAAFFGIGGVGGVLLFSGIDRRFGLAGALVMLIAPAAAGALLASKAAPGMAADLRRRGDDVVVARELERISGSGQTVPLLVCRGVDFSYGPLQVLFGVDFTVEAGELVALLGTNGAGKSTLLRVISGLGIPSRGAVHFRGEDVTFLEPDRRVGAGIAQVPGGRAVFGPMTVVENLRVVAAAAERSRRDTDAALDTVFETFPRLAERRNQPASTLSGGEQQMLGLSKALLLQPPLLLVDELSLGLAPKVVGELLQLVRRINEAGTAVVLVEQSVNVALSVAEHAYFMEKGEIRFDGPAAQLLDRRDLVRSVFLGGTAGRLAGARTTS